jgi:hypothetical protein
MVLSEHLSWSQRPSIDAGHVQVALQRLDVYWLSSLHLASDREGFLRWLHLPRGLVEERSTGKPEKGSPIEMGQQSLSEGA